MISHAELLLTAQPEYTRLLLEASAKLTAEAAANAGGIGSKRIPGAVRTGVDERGIWLRLSRRASHGWYVEYGRPAVHGHQLSWIQRGKRVFAGKVRAVAPRPFLRPAIDSVTEWLRGQVR